MPQLPLPVAGPIHAAVGPFLKIELETVDTAAFLADLIDLRGGVALAEGLADLDAPFPEVPETRPQDVRQQAAHGIRQITERLDDAISNAFKPRYRLPNPRRVLHLLKQAGAIETRKGRPLKTATRTVWAPMGDFLETHNKRARFGLRDLRLELRGAIAGLGPNAARLERLDTVLTDAAHSSIERLYRRVPYACDRRFAEVFKRAVKALPEVPTEADLAPAFEPGGWLAAELTHGSQLIRGVIDHERYRLEALVEAACTLATHM